MNPDLASALAAEGAAIYAYGLIGVHLTTEAGVADARAAELVHRNRRDVLVTRLTELKASTAPVPPGYELPFGVADQASAMKLAVHVEDGVAQAWRAALPTTEGADRTTALNALVDAAVRATRWRRRSGSTPVTLPFPGRP